MRFFSVLRRLAAGSILACGLAAATPGQGIATILETKVICREVGKYAGPESIYAINSHGHTTIVKRVTEADRYLGWGTIVQLTNHDLIVAFSGDRDTHICPWGKTQIIRSSDQGKTWSEPRTITNTPLDDRDAGLIQTRTGALVVSWFTSLAFTDERWPAETERYARHAEKVTQEERDEWLGHWVRRSEDGGKTWQKPVRTVSSSPHGPIQLRDGRLLYVGKADGKQGITFDQSTDDGRSWTVIAAIAQPVDLVEPHMVELPGGRLIALFRRELKDPMQQYVMQSESDDGGKTWSAVHTTGVLGYPPHVIPLKNGWLVMVYGLRLKPFSERACVSRDGGKTWDVDHLITLADAPGPDMGYPSSVQLEDGSILTVYYQADHLNEPTCFMSTHWRLN